MKDIQEIVSAESNCNVTDDVMRQAGTLRRLPACHALCQSSRTDRLEHTVRLFVRA